MKGRLFLIPNFLGDSAITMSFPPYNIEVINSIKHFIVEDARTVRRFLKHINKSINIDELSMTELNKRTRPEELQPMLLPLRQGYDVGIISEAGCPGVADPGADIVALAHEQGYEVIPLIGPSSILLAMMASGMNGQNFAFVGYLPVEKNSNVRAIKQLEERSAKEHQTQIFIETPFRNRKMLEELTFALRPSTKLCVASALTTNDQYIKTQTVKQWKTGKLPELSKKPTIYIIQA